MFVPFANIEYRPAIVGFRVTPDEKAILEAEAARRGLKVSELTRRAIGAFLRDSQKEKEHETQETKQA